MRRLSGHAALRVVAVLPPKHHCIPGHGDGANVQQVVQLLCALSAAKKARPRGAHAHTRTQTRTLRPAFTQERACDLRASVLCAERCGHSLKSEVDLATTQAPLIHVCNLAISVGFINTVILSWRNTLPRIPLENFVRGQRAIHASQRCTCGVRGTFHGLERYTPLSK